MQHTIYLTRQREFDYLQLQWLEKTTGRPSHEWDLYIIKELIDNALDADEKWTRQSGERIEIDISINYRHNAKENIYALEIAVTNCAPFPMDKNLLERIFDLGAYTSDKGHINYPTRGHQGNALTTLLGIPYALRHYGRGDYAAIRKPLVIESGTQSVVISLDIDELAQEAVLTPLEFINLSSPRVGTRIMVGIDYFSQERPRTIGDLQSWAQRFALFNPHANFHWQVQNRGQKATWAFHGDVSWAGRFKDVSPVQWYEDVQVRDLLLALQRQHGDETPLTRVIQIFAGFTAEEDPTGERAKTLCEQIDLHTLGELHIINDHGEILRTRLLPALHHQGRQVPAGALGGLSERHITERLTELCSLEKPPSVRYIVGEEPQDPTHPYVLELALAHLPAGQKRQIWTGLNHSPTYEEPFYLHRLYPPILDEDPVGGLDGFLDAYGQTIEQPVLLVLHLICPNLPYQDFAKTTIDPKPFRATLTKALDEMLNEFTRVETLETDEIQKLLHHLIPQAAASLSSDGKQYFSASQLYLLIRQLLLDEMTRQSRKELIEQWLMAPDSNRQLQNFVQDYTSQYPDVLTRLIQPERAHIVIPVHPNDYATMALSRIERQTLENACVNKLLLIGDPELEDLLIGNGLLNRFDSALLRSDDDLAATLETILPYLAALEMPLVLLHHATVAGCQLASLLRTQLNGSGLSTVSVIDLGLTPSQGKMLNLPTEMGSGGDRAALASHLPAEDVAFLVDARQQISLFSLTTNQIETWLERRFNEVGLATKVVPAEKDLRIKAITTIREQLAAWVVERFHAVYEVTLLVDYIMLSLKAELQPDDLLEQLYSQIEKEPMQASLTVWKRLIVESCQERLRQHTDQLDRWIMAHRPGTHRE